MNPAYGRGGPVVNGYSDTGSNSLTRGGGDMIWEKDVVTLRRAPKFGFGIAVSGGRDNPHFSSGETSIVISDVAPSGPADGLLKINDRILSVNGIPMDDVYHTDAVNALRQSGDTSTIAFRRKVPAPVRIADTRSSPRDLRSSPVPSGNGQYLRLRKNRNEGYGLRLGYSLHVEGVNEHGVAGTNGLRKGDKIIKINNVPVENLSLSDAHNMIERSRETLELDISRPNDNDSLTAVDAFDSYQPPPMLQPPSHNDGPTHVTPTHSAPVHSTPAPAPVLAPPRPPPPADEDEFVPPPPRPPSPGQDDFRDGMPVDPEGDAHIVSFHKGASVGLKLIGGNEVGIYVAGIKPGSPAEESGVAIADRISCVNDEIQLQGLTKEEVALLLLTLPDFITLEVRHSRAAFRRVMETGRGDKFYIKAHFAYNPPVGEELNFPRGSVFRVVDTFPEGAMGYWYSIRLDRNNIATERGLIPNNSRATQSNMAQQAVEFVRIQNQSGTRSEFFKRRGIRASGRRGKTGPQRIEIEDEYDDIIFGGQPIKFPAYERVILSSVGFTRPVVIFGSLADIARDELIRTQSDKFETPLTEHSFDRPPGEHIRMSSQGMVKLGSIKDIMDKGKHCLLDVTPHAVEQLNLMQYYPIVIFLNADSRSLVKEVRGHYMIPERNKGSKKLYKTSVTLKKAFSHIFTAMIPISADGGWLQNVKEAVRIQQKKEIWMSETKFDEQELDESHLAVVGPVILPVDYDTDAESIMPDTTLNSTMDSDQDLDQMSPASTTTGRGNSEEAFSFTKQSTVSSAPPPKAVDPLPKSDPPLKQYSDSEDEQHSDKPSSFDRRRKSRSRTPKKKESIWSSLRRSMSRSRSRSRDRRQEARDLEKEDDEEEKKEEQMRHERELREEQERREREEYERREEEERNRRLAMEHERAEVSYEPEERQHTRPDQHRRDEAREIAEEALRNRTQGSEDLTNLSTLVDELQKYGLGAPNSEHDPSHMHEPEPMRMPEPAARRPEPARRHEPEPEIIRAEIESEEESAPPPPMLKPAPRSTPRSQPVKPVISPVQHSAPIETDLDSVQAYPPKAVKPVMETTFGPESSDYDDDISPPPRMQAQPREAPRSSAPPSQPSWDIPDFKAQANSYTPTRPPPPDSDSDDDMGPPKPALPPARKPEPMKPSYAPPKRAEPPLLKPAQPPPPKPSEPAPLKPALPPAKVAEPAPLKPALPPAKVAEPAPLKAALPPAKRAEPAPLKPALPPAKVAEPAPLKPALPPAKRADPAPPKPALPPPKAAEPAPPKPALPPAKAREPAPVKTVLPPAKPAQAPPPKPVELPPKPIETKQVEPIYSQVQKNKPSPRESPVGWDYGSMDPPKPTQTSTPNINNNQQWGLPPEPEKQTIKVGSGFVNAEVKKVDLGGDKSEDELSADIYRSQLASAAKLYGRSESPRGWSGSNKGPPQIRKVQPPKPSSTGQTGNAYLDSKKARENFFMGENGLPKPAGAPYDRESYQAHKERTSKRSQSPGRLYQEKSGIYPPKNSYDKKGKQFKPIPIDEAALKSDEGQEVVATVRGTFDNAGGVLDSPSTGVSINIPKGAIPEGIRQDIYFKVCRDNSMLPPLDKNKGETLLSPLVMCGPHGLKFLKPIELKLPHTASNTQDGWQFKLKSSDAAQGEPAHWKNTNIPGMTEGQAKPVTKTVSVMVDHF